MTVKLCVKEALLIRRHKQTFNIQKEAYETLLFTLLVASKTLQRSQKNLIGVVGHRVFVKHVLHVLKLYKANHRFNIVAAEKLEN